MSSINMRQTERRASAFSSSPEAQCEKQTAAERGRIDIIWEGATRSLVAGARRGGPLCCLLRGIAVAVASSSCLLCEGFSFHSEIPSEIQ